MIFKQSEYENNLEYMDYFMLDVYGLG